MVVLCVLFAFLLYLQGLKYLAISRIFDKKIKRHRTPKKVETKNNPERSDHRMD